MKTLNLKQYSVDDLLTLRDRINAMLESRVDRERLDLEKRLKRLQRFKAASTEPRKPVAMAAEKVAKKKKKNAKPTKKVAPKFRNPENSSETWTGAACSRVGCVPLSMAARKRSRIFGSEFQGRTGARDISDRGMPRYFIHCSNTDPVSTAP